jgi:nucleotide-binding universal stress UspA family protein
MERIVVGVDGSDGSLQALRWAVTEGALREATVAAVIAWHQPYVGVTPMGSMGVDPDPEVFIQAARTALAEAVAAVDASALRQPVEQLVVMGGPGGALLESAQGADLLVVGSRGHGGFAGLLLGSVSHQVTHHAPCPVVIVPTR